ncbi:MAG: hypothetical protein ABI324_24950 [Ktedonobacteraceae bacterium]
MPFLTVSTPPLVDAMMDDFYWRRWRYFDDLSHPRQAEATQAQVAVRTHDDPVLHDLGWRRTGRPWLW